MSTAFGAIGNTDGKPGDSGNDSGPNFPEDGSSGTAGNVSQLASKPSSIFGGFETFKPAAAESFAGTGDTNRTADQPRRTKSGKIDRRTRAGRTQETSSDLEEPVYRGRKPIKLISLEKAILSMHDMAAGIFEVPELSLNEQEARDLSDCIKDVGQYYVESFDPKKVAIFNLVSCMGGIYALRVMAYRNRMERQRRGKLQAMPGPAHDLNYPGVIPPNAVPSTPPAAPPIDTSLNPPIVGGGDFDDGTY